MKLLGLVVAIVALPALAETFDLPQGGSLYRLYRDNRLVAELEPGGSFGGTFESNQTSWRWAIESVGDDGPLVRVTRRITVGEPREGTSSIARGGDPVTYRVAASCPAGAAPLACSVTVEGP